MYILIPIPIPNWKSRGFPIPIPRQCGGFPIKMGTGSGNTHKTSLFAIPTSITSYATQYNYFWWLASIKWYTQHHPPHMPYVYTPYTFLVANALSRWRADDSNDQAFSHQKLHNHSPSNFWLLPRRNTNHQVFHIFFFHFT